MKLRIHRFLPFTRVEGPGNRACLWVQGCSINCPGCAVPWTWAQTGGKLVEVAELLDQVLCQADIEGITFLGGEPFDQAKALSQLGLKLKEAGLSVMTFTGYTLEELYQSNCNDRLNLLAVTDLLVDGSFHKEHLDLRRPWVGSTNQKYHFLTDRYQYLEAELLNIPNRLEVRLHPSGEISINGMARSEQLKRMLDNL